MSGPHRTPLEQPLPPLPDSPLSPNPLVELFSQTRSDSQLDDEKGGEGLETKVVTWDFGERGVMGCIEVLRTYVEAESPDILILTHTHDGSYGRDESLSFLRPLYNFRYHTSLLTLLCRSSQPIIRIGKKEKHLKIFGIAGAPDAAETEERVITMEFGSLVIIAVAAPVSGTPCSAEKYRAKREKFIHALLEQHLFLLTKRYLLVGFFGAVSSRLDVERPDEWWDVKPGAMQWEREAMDDLREKQKLEDVWQALHPNGSSSSQETPLGGVRMDGFLASSRLMPRIKSCEMRHQVRELFTSTEEEEQGEGDGLGRGVPTLLRLSGGL